MQKKGLGRWMGYRIGKLAELANIYSWKDAFRIFSTIYRKRSGYEVKASFLKQPLFLRDNFSDKAIFQQVFTELQYLPHNYPFPEVKTILDAGANIGMASIFFSNRFPNASILAVEPEQANFQLLEKNLAGYEKVQCLKAALWGTNEHIHISNPDSLAAGFTVEKSESATNLLEGYTIDTLKHRMGWDTIDMVKLDIEGAEKEVFEGDTGWLAGVKLLIIEVHDHYKKGCSKALFKALEPYDYECFYHHENIFIKFNKGQ